MKRLGTLAHRLLAIALAGTGLLAIPVTAQAPVDVRIALIIGNSAYPGSMALANPSNDARDMAATLRNMGFGVIEVRDASRAQMIDAIERASRQLRGKQGVGMLFYAGHGLQLDWHNFMVPVDARLNSAKDVPGSTVDVEIVMSAFKVAGNRMNIVVLDACRDNPFSNDKTASAKGLAPLDAPTGTFLAYATAPGNVAADGVAGAKNGLYTGYLLEELKKPSTSIENVFKRVRFAVRRSSNGAQVPWETTSLEDDFVFNSGIKKVVSATEAQTGKNFEIEKANWDNIKNSKKADDFYAYLLKYPNGLISEQATFALEQLSKVRVIAQADKNGMIQNLNEKRFRVGDEYVTLTKDNRTGQEIKRNTVKVAKIAGGLVYLQGTSGDEVKTEDGATVSGYATDGFFEYDPPTVFQPGDGFQIGKKWTSRTTQTFRKHKSWRIDEGHVISSEVVTVPAGTFKTYKVVVVAQLQNGFHVKNTFWYQPGWGVAVKRVRENYNADNRLVVNETYELVSRTRGPT